MKLKSLYFFMFAAFASLYPFLTYYFQTRGFSYTEIGIAYALFSVVGVIAQPIWGYVTDKYSTKRNIIIITMFLSSIVIYNFVFAKSFYYVLFSIILLLCFQSPVIPVTDSYCYEIIDHHKQIQYGKIRLMGSIGYALAALFLGSIVKQYGINSAFFLYFITMFIGAFIVFSLNYKDKSTTHNLNISDFTMLFRNRKFCVLMLSVIFANIAMGSNSSYVSVLIQKTGGDVSQLGILWFILAISELPTFFLGTKLLGKFGECKLLIIAMVLFTLRYFLDSICTSYNFVIAVQAMQGITYPLFFTAALQFVNKLAPRKMRTSSMTLFSAFSGLGGFIGNICSGILLEHISIFVLFKLISSMCIISLGFAVVLKYIKEDATRVI